MTTYYDTDQRIRSVVSFTTPDPGAPGGLVDPLIVGVSLTTPTGDYLGYLITDAGSPIVRDGLGVYHLDVTPDQAGVWRVQWEGRGVALDEVDEQVFIVREPTV